LRRGNRKYLDSHYISKTSKIFFEHKKMSISNILPINASCGQAKNSSIDEFIADITNISITINDVIDKNLSLTDLSNKPTSYLKARDSIITNQFTAYRQGILKCNTKMSYFDFDEMDALNIEGTFDYKTQISKSTAYYLRCGGKNLFPVLVQDEKIIAIIIMKKGIKQYFMMW